MNNFRHLSYGIPVSLPKSHVIILAHLSVWSSAIQQLHLYLLSNQRGLLIPCAKPIS
jgi:hypothetical protein